MKNNLHQKNVYEFGISTVLVVLLILILNPFHFWMPSMIVDTILVLILVFFGMFATYLLQESVFDEREQYHKILSGRFAFLSGATVLIIAMIFQEIHGHVDPWVFSALVVMILVKIITRIYIDRKY